MEAFGVAGWQETPGRGWVAVIAGSAGYDPKSLVGMPVSLSGSVYMVRGIEPVADNPTGKAFGLLVSDPVVTG